MWSFGKSMAEARTFVAEVLPLLLHVLSVYEGVFNYPSPLERFAVQDLELLRSLERPPGTPPGLTKDHLGYGLNVRVEALAKLLISYYKRKSDKAMVRELEDFLKRKPEPGPKKLIYIPD